MRRQTKAKLKGLLAVAAIFSMTVGAASMKHALAPDWHLDLPSYHPAPPTCDGSSWIAQRRAMDAVRESLLAPSTATVHSPDHWIKKDAGLCTITFLGDVDAQNAFGATLRKRYGSTVERHGDDDLSWTVAVAATVD